MKANPDQPAGARVNVAAPAGTHKNLHKVVAVDPPVKRKTWFNSYDEEWAAFLAAESMKKSRPGFNSNEPELLPRVWNCPQLQ
jgi:hypothetical protein